MKLIQWLFFSHGYWPNCQNNMTLGRVFRPLYIKYNWWIFLNMCIKNTGQSAKITGLWVVVQWAPCAKQNESPFRPSTSQYIFVISISAKEPPIKQWNRSHNGFNYPLWWCAETFNESISWEGFFPSSEWQNTNTCSLQSHTTRRQLKNTILLYCAC